MRNPSSQAKTEFDIAVPLGSEMITVHTTRKRVHNLNLRVHRDGSVVLSIPWHTSVDKARAFIDVHATWIAASRERQLDRVAACARAAGQDTHITSYSLWGELHHLPPGSFLTPAELDELYRAEVARVLPGIVAQREPDVGASARAWQLRAMKSRWGSCTPATGRIRINVRLAAYPVACLDYVVVHELTHLLEPSHNQRFHSLVACVIPHEKALRARMRQRPEQQDSTV